MYRARHCVEKLRARDAQEACFFYAFRILGQLLWVARFSLESIPGLKISQAKCEVVFCSGPSLA